MATGTSSYINGALCKHLCPTNDTRFRLGPPAARTFYVHSCLIANHSLRSFLARLRGGTAPLAIETGHYVGMFLQKNEHVIITMNGWKMKILTSYKCTEL